MDVVLSGIKIAIMTADGFDEHHMTAVQRALTTAKGHGKVVAPEQGLVNGWQGNSWGHYFTADAKIGDTLGSDYDALIVLGGERATTKLKANPHTRRIINHFLEAHKPLAAIGSGVALLALSPKSSGLSVAVPEALADEVQAAGMIVVTGESVHQAPSVLTATGDDIAAWLTASMTMFIAAVPQGEEIAA